MSKHQHISYINQKGTFHIQCSRAIFSNEEIQTLEKYGHWFKALIDGTLSPISEEQEAFIDVFRNNNEAITPEQVAWFKYTNRLANEKANPEKYKLNYISNFEDSFFSRSDWKTMRTWRNG